VSADCSYAISPLYAVSSAREALQSEVEWKDGDGAKTVGRMAGRPEERPCTMTAVQPLRCKASDCGQTALDFVRMYDEYMKMKIASNAHAQGTPALLLRYISISVAAVSVFQAALSTRCDEYITSNSIHPLSTQLHPHLQHLNRHLPVLLLQLLPPFRC